MDGVDDGDVLSRVQRLGYQAKNHANTNDITGEARAARAYIGLADKLWRLDVPVPTGRPRALNERRVSARIADLEPGDLRAETEDHDQDRETERLRLAAARIGQHLFAQNVLANCRHTCVFCGLQPSRFGARRMLLRGPLARRQSEIAAAGGNISATTSARMAHTAVERLEYDGDEDPLLRGDLLAREAGHGTFVAGIIMRLSPELRIRQVGVLDRPGWAMTSRWRPSVSDLVRDRRAVAGDRCTNRAMHLSNVMADGGWVITCGFACHTGHSLRCH
jgi:hypothetical protein